MNPLMLLIRLLKPILYPLSLIYGIIVWLRNKLYDNGILSSIQFSVPVICVGNLSTGGTGKTPHIEYLIRLLQYEYKLATMSRGYKRKTTGFYLADRETDSWMIGDEPMQFYKKFPELAVSVCEDRMTGIPRLLSERKETEIVLLDDAFQHRSVKPGLNILITDYARPFYSDFILPFGSLRESRKAYKRADIIVVSKCPDLNNETQKEIVSRIRPQKHQRVFFSKITYDFVVDFFTGEQIHFNTKPNIIMVSGIAKPEPMLQFLRENVARNVHLLKYPDHHFFSEANLEEIKQTYRNWNEPDKIIITTEKDATRLEIHKEALLQWNIKIAILPIKIAFLHNQHEFDAIVRNYIETERAEIL
ncbi:tetraacyldisaccharide 4'-kinase [Taibaiella lutea]|uniref:Tetraacyldisaccharide 4'-kinase n=1 Tax=Taibaiella lutea TaxID=2608001 RepID=A0A5M6CVI8_9BACT|nr:tetraacyldisaccharide 4'-kinase [Taibaiella lutea]KAA5537229.1 tetraacyldisaccharide 4'-kinase [Taibaiella lutea]